MNVRILPEQPPLWICAGLVSFLNSTHKFVADFAPERYLTNIYFLSIVPGFTAESIVGRKI